MNAIPEGKLPSDKVPGHWLLARLGKKVLRPGGREMTWNLLNSVNFKNSDVCEIAPGLGDTANEILTKNPKSYVGIEVDETAAKISQEAVGNKGNVIHATASHTSLADDSVDILIGEAMLTMQIDKIKLEIMREAFRILRNNGYCLIHELGLRLNELEADRKQEIQKELSQIIRVNARPLTLQEWESLLEEAGFKVEKKFVCEMHFLEPQRLLADEGVGGVLNIAKNLLLDREARERVFAMKNCFKKFNRELCAVGLVAKKNN